MDEPTFTCESCGNTTDRGDICFACHIKTVTFGYTWGQESFHGPTIGEVQRKTVEDALQAGITAEPVTNWQ